MSIKSFFNISTIYILMWCLYSLQGILYRQGSIISQSLLVVLLLMSVFYFYRVNTQKTLPSFLKAINVFVGMSILYGSILIFSQQELYITEGDVIKVSNFTYLKDILISLLPIYPVYYFSKNGLLTESHIRLLIIPFLVVVTLLYYGNQATMMTEAMNLGSIREEFTNNFGYTFVHLIPLLLFLKKRPIIQYIALIFCVAYIVFAMKRGAILIGVICVLYFFISSFKTSNKKIKIAIIALSLVGGIIIVQIINNMLESSEYFIYRIEQTMDGDSSHRDYIYKLLYNHFMEEQNLFRFLFGNGACATLIIGDNYAHNDWLELAINQGMLGLIVYLFFYLSLIKDMRLGEKNSTERIILQMCIIILFMASIFSMTYTEIDIYLSIAIGYSLASIYSQKESSKDEHLYNHARLSR